MRVRYLFSFGAVLYEMATGKAPFNGSSSGEIISAILRDEPPAPSSLNSEVSRELEAVILKALEKDRTMRYQHASDIRTDLQRLKRDSDSRRLTAANGGTSHNAKRTMPNADGSSSRKKLLSTVGVAIVVVLAMAWFFNLKKRDSGLLPFQNIQLQKLTESGKVSRAAISPDGKYLAYVMDEEQGQQSLRMRRVPEGGDTQDYRSSDRPVCIPHFLT